MAPRRAARLALALLAASLRPASGVVTVHVVPHTHDDVGWLKTVDQYFTGQNNSIQHANVRMILDTVMQCLLTNPERTFTYVEVAFFERWWQEQTPLMRQMVRGLVEKGQLSFANGGWCMHDEGAPFYLDMIDQTTLGHRFLMEELGVSPKVGWQLDPFGHSATQAALLSAEVGFTGLYFGRIDYQDLAARVNNSAAEFIWRASPSLGSEAQVFTGLTGSYGGNYGPPSGFDWDVFSADEPIQDNPAFKDYNVQSRVDDFVAAALEQAKHTRGSNVMFTMGSDFQYESALEWFRNLDKIIEHANKDGRVRAIYSNPEVYTAAKAKETSVAWPLKTDDFFPYADGPHDFWTGYFTSRPALKRYIRDSSAMLQMVRQMDAAAGAGGFQDDGLTKLERAMGVNQHHDAVSGTAKQHVTNDYAARLAEGRLMVLPLAAAALQKLGGAAGAAKVAVCDLRNVSVCAATQAFDGSGAPVEFLLWNGLAQARRELVELPIGSCEVAVQGPGGEEVLSQIVPSLASVTNYGGDAGGSSLTLLFQADVPPLGFKAYRLVGSSSSGCAAREERSGNDATLLLENEFLGITFCNGLMCRMIDKSSGVTTSAIQSWWWYNSSTGDAEDLARSGAYIFRPSRQTAFAVGDLTAWHVIRGPLAQEVHQTFGDWVSQRFRIVQGAQHIEITNTVGPIPVEDGLGKEVVTRIETGIQNAGECQTDSNGREMIWRKRDFRSSWDFSQTEPVAGNYFPVNAAIFIRDEQAQLTLLTETSQAGSGSVRDGQLEIMVHRRVLVDDNKGVGEPLNETQDVAPYLMGKGGEKSGPGLVVRSRHRLIFSTPGAAAAVWRPQVDQMYMPIAPFFPEGGPSPVSVYTALKRPLPPNVQIVSLYQWDETHVLLRLAHQFGAKEDAVLSGPVDVDLSDLFQDLHIDTVEERGLAASISRAEVLRRRVKWHVEGEEEADVVPAAERSSRTDGLVFSLGPLQIRTFMLGIAPKQPSTAFV